ncbi:uncharacterized protein LOC126332186 [Schistocerca gregaria]|uniref:uncharacterized protein LOC126332186 n=1 Tax=Schistocerca gregaria TaxID=7010 RepID=UPI00211E86D8|nr:uncharacterized protein LOC126332186 [Schistocerca gregaria]
MPPPNTITLDPNNADNQLTDATDDESSQPGDRKRQRKTTATSKARPRKATTEKSETKAKSTKTGSTTEKNTARKIPADERLTQTANGNGTPQDLAENKHTQVPTREILDINTNEDDDEDSNWQTVENKKSRRNSMPKKADIHTNTPQDNLAGTETKLKIENLNTGETQKSLYEQLKILNVLQHVQDMAVYTNRTATITSFHPDIETLIRRTIGTQYRPEAKITRLTKQNKLTQNKQLTEPSLSVVITKVTHDVTEKDIEEELTNLGLEFTKVKRIISREYGKPIQKVRVISRNKNTIDELLTNHFRIFRKFHPVEQSHVPPPQPAQCAKCHTFDHTTENCRNKPVCNRCGGQHPIAACQQEISKPTCVNCNGEHLSTDINCPKRPKAPVSIEATAKIVCTDKPTKRTTDEETTPQAVVCEDFIRATTLALINILPDRKNLVITAMKDISRAFFGRQMNVSQAWNRIHFSISPAGNYQNEQGQDRKQTEKPARSRE